MKKLIFLPILLFSVICFGQTIRIENGVAFSGISGDNGFYEISNKFKAGYGGFMAVDYLEKKFFYLSSKIGYRNAGGLETVLVKQDVNEPGEEKDIHLNFNELQLTTSIRAKLPLNRLNFYVGAGPALNYQLSSNTSFDDNKFEDIEGSLFYDRKFLLGFIAEAGFFYDISRIRLGVGLDYTFNKYKDFTNNTLFLNFNVGYKF